MNLAAILLGAAALTAVPAYSQKTLPPEQSQGVQYHFRKEDAAKLRQHYENIDRVDTRNRTELNAGGKLPDDWRGWMRPVPADVVRELPPAPAGYSFGYIDGYSVVYDPSTGCIADAIDLTKP